MNSNFTPSVTEQQCYAATRDDAIVWGMMVVSLEIEMEMKIILVMTRMSSQEFLHCLTKLFNPRRHLLFSTTMNDVSVVVGM
jgi:hypothetical protein